MDPLTADPGLLAEDAVERSKKIAARYARIFPKHEADLLSSAQFGAAKALGDWNPDEGATWNYWLGVRVKCEIRMYLRKAAQRRERSPKMEFDALPARPDGSGFAELISVLPEKFIPLMKLIYEEGITPASAGVELGYTKQHGCRLHKEALAILREKVA